MMLLSNCCDAPILGDEIDPICSACKEHCEYYDDEKKRKFVITPSEQGV